MIAKENDRGARPSYEFHAGAQAIHRRVVITEKEVVGSLVERWRLPRRANAVQPSFPRLSGLIHREGKRIFLVVSTHSSCIWAALRSGLARFMSALWPIATSEVQRQSIGG